MNERKFSFDEVKNMLCELCRHGVPIVFSCDQGSDPMYHMANGKWLSCTADAWRNQVACLLNYEEAKAKKEADEHEAKKE